MRRIDMNYDLAIFDFDGTLADSFPFFVSVFNTIAERHQFRQIDTARIDSLRHLSARQMMQHVGMPAWKLPVVSKTFITMMKESAANVPVFEGIDAALRAIAAHGIELAIISSNSEQNVRAVLGVELSGLIGRFECGMSIFGKASRLKQLIRDSGTSPASAIYIGDQDTDAIAAGKSGMAFGAVSWGYAPIEILRAHNPTVEFATPACMARYFTS